MGRSREGFSAIVIAPERSRESRDPWPLLEEDMMMVGRVGMVGHAKTRDHHGGVESRVLEETQKFKNSSVSANETVHWFFGNLLAL